MKEKRESVCVRVRERDKETETDKENAYLPEAGGGK